MEAPRNTPAAIAKVMNSCWHSSPEQRPTFADIVQTFKELKEQD